MSYKRIAPAGLVPLGLWSTTLSNSTAYGLDSTCDGATAILFSVETNDVRYRDDGTDPTLTTGVVYKKDLAPYYLEGVSGSALRFQRSTGSATVNVMAYKRPGEQG